MATWRERVGAFDAAVDEWVDHYRSPALDHVFYACSSAADHGLLWLAIAAVRSAREGEPARAARLGAAMGIESAITNGLVKTIFRRVRPAAHAETGPLPYGMHRPLTTSFPSGHAASAMTAATLLSQDHRGGGAYFALGAWVASSRVYVRMHHASDVVAGAALGLVMGQVLKRLLDRGPKVVRT